MKNAGHGIGAGTGRTAFKAGFSEYQAAACGRSGYEKQCKATDLPQAVVRQVSDVAERLAKLPKKKNGIKL